MGEPVPISLGLRTNPAKNQQAGNAQLINCYAEEHGDDGKVSWIIYATEGLTALGSELAGGGIRAMIVVGNRLYAAAGRNVYSVNSAGSSTLIGGIPTEGPVYMERNRKIPAQIGIVSGGLYYVIDTLANTLTEIVDPDLPAPISISTLDGYGIIPVTNGEFMLTGIDEFTTIDGLDVGTAEAYPDEIIRSMVLERELVLFGEDSIEWHQNTGDPDFPFTRVHALELGCLSGDAVSKVDTPDRKTLIWVAPDHTVRRMNGYGGQVISTNEIHELIKTLERAGNISQLKSCSWAYEGNYFYALTCESWTRVYNSKTGHWHTRKSYLKDRWRVGSVVRFGDKLVAGDYETGQLYIMELGVFEEAGDYLISEIITPDIGAFPYGIKVSGLFIEAATGVGLNSVDDHAADPKIMVSWSKDSGHSWSNERERTLHRTAQYKRVKPIYRLGKASSRGMQLRFRISSPVERVMMQASIAFDQLKA